MFATRKQKEGYDIIHSMKKKILVLIVAVVVGSFVPYALSKFPGDVEVYTRHSTGTGYSTCAEVHLHTGFPFGIIRYYSPGCPADVHVYLNILGLILNILVYVLIFKLVKKFRNSTIQARH